MTIGDALYVTTIGMGTVLFSLLIVALVINIVKKFVDQKEKSNAQTKANENYQTSNQVSKETLSKVETNTEEQEDNKKIVASIAASLYVMLNQSDTEQLVIKKITRINQHSTEWGKAGRRDQIKAVNKL